MKFNIIGRNMNVADNLKTRIEKKLSKLSRFFPEDTVASVTVSSQKDTRKIEVTIPVKGSSIRAEESSDDIFNAIDQVEAVLERQIIRHRSKLIDKFQQGQDFSELFGTSEEELEEESEVHIEKVKSFDFKPMDPEEACLEMDLLGHNFFVFNDSETGDTCVVYKRKNNTYGMIVPEK